MIRHPAEVFAAFGIEGVETIDPETLGVFRSGDQGDHWEDVSEGLTNRNVRALVADGDGTLYAGTTGGGVFRSTYLVPVELSEFSVD